ncbi:unnamed protein product [Prorocentrum cordatum]|uniref:Uncharacterized protein n=1 Tax=Prorocentrum cordatum TaxID=2364126 RepID=A0ABN9TQ06_9DINO|nr:unnamed protein product [Polarella glacialis]
MDEAAGFAGVLELGASEGVEGVELPGDADEKPPTRRVRRGGRDAVRRASVGQGRRAVVLAVGEDWECEGLDDAGEAQCAYRVQARVVYQATAPWQSMTGAPLWSAMLAYGT